LVEERVGFGEGGRCFEGVEDLPGLHERAGRLGRLAEGCQAAALAEECVGPRSAPAPSPNTQPTSDRHPPDPPPPTTP
jgi:hypothetical protein